MNIENINPNDKNEIINFFYHLSFEDMKQLMHYRDKREQLYELCKKSFNYCEPIPTPTLKVYPIDVSVEDNPHWQNKMFVLLSYFAYKYCVENEDILANLVFIPYYSVVIGLAYGKIRFDADEYLDFESFLFPDKTRWVYYLFRHFDLGYSDLGFIDEPIYSLLSMKGKPETIPPMRFYNKVSFTLNKRNLSKIKFLLKITPSATISFFTLYPLTNFDLLQYVIEEYSPKRLVLNLYFRYATEIITNIVKFIQAFPQWEIQSKMVRKNDGYYCIVLSYSKENRPVQIQDIFGKYWYQVKEILINEGDSEIIQGILLIDDK